MIEDVLFLTLGFCVAVVLALACLPILWARALRLTRQRLELLVPWSKEEIDAERDGWRAQAAVMQRRLEQDVERGRDSLAARDVELGHRTASLSRAEAAFDELDAVRRNLLADLAAQGRELRDSEGQRGALEKALHDADRQIETDAVEAQQQRRRYDLLSEVSEERRGAIAALETRVAGLNAKVEDRDDALAKSSATLAELAAAKASRESELETTRAALTRLAAEHETATSTLADERARGAERDGRLQRRTEALAAAEVRMVEQEDALKRRSEELAALQRRFDVLQGELRSRQAGDAENDETLRQALRAVADDSLRLLAPDATHMQGDTSAGGELVREQP